MLQRASWLIRPFGPAPTISQSRARYFEGLPAVGSMAVGKGVLPLDLEAMEEGRLCVDVEGMMLRCEEPAVLLGGAELWCLGVRSDGFAVDAPFTRGGTLSCLDFPDPGLFSRLLSMLLVWSKNCTRLQTNLCFPCFCCLRAFLRGALAE